MKSTVFHCFSIVFNVSQWFSMFFIGFPKVFICFIKLLIVFNPWGHCGEFTGFKPVAFLGVTFPV